ncbi:helix-turn-helix domain-containing protein [Streptomyces sp. NPDC001351]|uniref:helix-turn-helix domain-containing protein n=1 Tax=Streptomyces sp. NPDC001351 TaxID=3364564 RepID=UPI0036C710DD
MDTENPSVPPHAQSRVAANNHPNRRDPETGGGLIHDHTRHTTRFTVIGNHLTQHPELSLLAIGLGAHIQSLPPGASVDIKTLAARFPEGPTRIAAALRELEAHGYLRRERKRITGGRIVTRTISCNQPRPHRAHRPDHTAAAPAAARPCPTPAPALPAARSTPLPKKRPARPLPAVPHPAYPAPSLLQTATDLLTGLRNIDPSLLLSAHDAAHLTPGVAAWLERDVSPAAVRHALTSDLPPEGPRRPAALLAHRLTALLPPPPPFRAPTEPPAAPPRFQTCEGCDRAFRSPAPGLCRDCRTPLATAA